MQKWLWILFMLTAIIGPSLAQTDELPYFEEVDCIFGEIEDVICGYLAVPESRADTDSPEIYLAVAIISARNGDPEPDPVIYLEGGPGGAALLAVENFLAHPLRENRELILFDQRGTGFSEPSLNCIEVELGEGDDPSAACYARLVDEGINLSAYNSAESAADISDLAFALGYDQVNLYGISYGTRLALTTMRDFPDVIRAVVIDSVFPPEVNADEQGPADLIGAFDYFFSACAEDAACSAAYPTLEEDFYAMIEAFNLEPPTFEYDAGDGPEPFELLGDDLLNSMFQTLYITEAIPLLPYGITLLANAQDDADFSDGYDILNGFWTVEAWINGENEGGESGIIESDGVLAYIDELGDISDSEGMYNAVTCVEEFPFQDFDAGYDLLAGAHPAIQGWLASHLDSTQIECEVWAVDFADSIEAERVLSDIPTLLISGGFDPVTPPSYGDSALEGLSNGQHIVFANGGHGISGSPGCAADLAAAFIDAPDAPLDTACVEAAAQGGWDRE